MLHILHFIFLIIFLYLLFSTVYMLILAIAGHFRRPEKYAAIAEKSKIAVVIPSYKEDGVIIHTAQEAAAHNYPKDKFQVTVIADKLQPATIEALRNIPVNVVEVKFDVSMKAKSLNAALQSLAPGNFDIVMILDADNIMAPDCLEKVNDAFSKGHKVVQCHRVAKNQNTPVALLDAISEEMGNHILRKGQRALGLPSSIIGSGVAFDYKLVSEIFSLPKIQNNPGEDREIDIQLVKRGIGVEFISGAYIYDEKVASVEVFEKQRLRWLEAQLVHVKGYLTDELKEKRTTSVYLNKLWQGFLLARLLYLVVFGGVFIFILLQQLFHFSVMYPAPIWWIAVALTYFTMLLISIPKRFYTLGTLKAIIYIPVLAVSMVKSLLKIETNRQQFIHTEKTYTTTSTPK